MPNGTGPNETEMFAFRSVIPANGTSNFDHSVLGVSSISFASAPPDRSTTVSGLSRSTPKSRFTVSRSFYAFSCAIFSPAVAGGRQSELV